MPDPDADLRKPIEPNAAADGSSDEEALTQTEMLASQDAEAGDNKVEYEAEKSGAEKAETSTTEAETDSEAELTSISLKDRLLDIKTLAGFGISALILVFFAFTVKIDFAATFKNILSADFTFLFLGFLVYYSAFYVRGLRWRMLLNNAGFQNELKVKLPNFAGLIEIIYLSWFVNCLVPAKLGDAYRGYLLKKNGNASFSRTLGTIFAERIADVLVLFGLLSLGGLFAFNNVESKLSSIYLVFIFGLILVVAIVCGLIALRFWSHQIARLVPARFQAVFHRFQQGTVSSFHRSTQLKLYSLTTIIWLCEGARLYFVLQSLHITTLDPSVVIFIALASSLLTTLPFTPAGLGAVEGTVVGVLTIFSIDKNLATSVAILDRVISYWSIILFGALLYIFSRKK